MFKEIYVKNLVLIDELHLTFEKGLSTFTGETGAGKSLLIDSISLLCGARASSDYIGNRSDTTLIEGVFDLEPTHPAILLCQEEGIEVEDEFIVSRKISKDGKSSVKINQRSVPLSFLREVMSLLIDIHSQHDTQYLMNSKSHLVLLDNYANHATLLKNCEVAYKEYISHLNEYEKIRDNDLNPSDLDYLKYQIKEIEALDLSEEKVNEYEDELKTLNSFERLFEHLSSSHDSLSGTQKTLENLYDCIRSLESIDEFEWIQDVLLKLKDSYYEIEEVAGSLSDHLSSLEYDENRVNELNEFLYQLNNLKRKYGNSVKDILNKKEEFSQKIDCIENAASVLENLKMKVDESFKNYERAASVLSVSRKKAALLLEDDIVRECKDLYLDNIQFHVNFEDMKPSQKGNDKVEFYISMNPGEPLRSLASVASGGELSRLMLGLKSIFANLVSINTIIFDEIDTGVSGKVALAIGKKMRHIANTHQVFAITHLASVAACGNHHFEVVKHQMNDSTSTQICELNYDEIISALAYISSNSNTSNALEAARELYRTAQNDNE